MDVVRKQKTENRKQKTENREKMIVSPGDMRGGTIEIEGEMMAKIWVNFDESNKFLLFDPRQGVLRRKKNSSGEQIPIEVLETEFVKGKISEGLLIKVDSPRKIKEK